MEKNARDRYMTCDIALEGNDKFVAVVWYGWVAMKIYTVAKSGGRNGYKYAKTMGERVGNSTK